MQSQLKQPAGLASKCASSETLQTHTHTHSAHIQHVRKCKDSSLTRTQPGTKLKLSVSGVDKIVCTCMCVCRSNTGAVRDAEEETGLLPFELDLEKKAVFPSCQISFNCYASEL